jgi:SAM-dependent methyltransferase
MQERHLDRVRYSKEQGETTKKYVIPYVQDLVEINENTRVLEIGCGEGGNLIPFMEIGCRITGVDLNVGQVEVAKEVHSTHPNNKNLTLIADDIYNISEGDIGKFDLIMMRDVIEHIPNQEVFLNHLKQFLSEKGKVFFGFPPWQMPFGGHQQICENKFASKLPYYHLLPYSLYKGILKMFREKQETIEELVEIKDTGIIIERFQKIVSKNEYKVDKKTIYFINPNYEVKFNLKPRKQLGVVAGIPVLRNFLSTCAYYVISLK